MEFTVPLEGLFMHLVRNGFPLSARDYQDALKALRCGYGLHRREDLLWLCQTLWARSDQELSRIQRLFRDFPRPSPSVVNKVETNFSLKDETTEDSQNDKRPYNERSRRTQRFDQAPEVEFTTPTQSGIGLPRVKVRHDIGDIYIHTPRSLIGLRSLIIAWRRFRLAQRSGPRVELNIEATIAEQCRRGMLVDLVLVPARRNHARVTVLIDASPSMITWHHMNQLLSESLERSQLAHTAIYFFDNTPVENLHEVEKLNRPIQIARALEINAHCALLVVSDAGAARGSFDRGRLVKTKKFIEQVGVSWHPIAWLNPMPRTRWVGTTAERVSRLPGLAMFELTEDGFIHAIDFMRGKLNV
jgi:uncharacterized protein with von Willebrand factor type A (vWA) domain